MNYISSYTLVVLFLLYPMKIVLIYNVSLTIDAEGAQTSAMKVALDLMRQKGIGGIYRGFGATFLRCSLMNFSFFYSFFRRIYMNSLKQLLHFHQYFK